ncbi:MAG TPA: hypothetical protein VJR92_11425 [Gemmatimonadaceae bacterium]|nr:hypothetical protein [Gemmatimonadaceae bacterium]
MFAKPRLVVALLALAACSSDVNSPSSGTVTQWLVSAIELPLNASQADDFAYDLDGDGTPDNQFGNVLSALTQAAGFDLQAGMDAGISDGDIVQLIRFQSDDATLTADAAAGATWYVGQTTAGYQVSPHQIDNTYDASVFAGPLSSSDYSSRNPATTTNPVAIMLPIRLFASAPVVYVPMNGVHVEWSFTATTGMMNGRIHGSIREADINTFLVPALAETFNAVITAAPASDEAVALLDLFDVGGCGGATADDGVISVCELENDNLIQTLLRPDATIYNASGGYKPGAAGVPANALTFGVGFTAIRTTF